MKLTIQYPVTNKVFIDNPWPVRLDNRTLLIEMDGRFAKSVGIQLTGVPVSEAIRIVEKPERARDD